MSSTQADAPNKSMILEPDVPGTSAKFTGGAPFSKYLFMYSLAAVGIFAIWGATGGVLLPNQVQNIEFAKWFTGNDAGVNLQQLNDLKAAVAAHTVTPTAEQTRLLGLLAGFDAARASSLSIVTSVGVFLTMLSQPVAGILSDRTKSSWGRRAPWIVGGAVLGAGLLIALRYSPSIGLMVALWSIAQIVINMAQGPLTTTIADRVIEEKLGVASGITGLGTMIGATVGGVAAGLAFGALGLDTYYPFALALAIFAILFALVERDRSSADLVAAPMNWGGFFQSFIIPLRDADYRWVWLAKIVMMFGYSVSYALNFFILQSYVQPAMSQAQATQTAPLLSLIGLPFMMIAMVVAGKWSDKIKRRKPFVFWTSIILAASLVVPLVWPSLPAMLIQAVVGGLAIGAYMVVDQSCSSTSSSTRRRPAATSAWPVSAAISVKHSDRPSLVSLLL